MSIKHGIVLGCPRSGTTYLMSVLDTIPTFECLSGTLLPVAIPHVVNHDLDQDVYQALATGFERAIDAYLHSGRYHSKAAAIQKWLRAPDGWTGLLKAIQGKRDLPSRMIYKEPFLSLSPRFVLDAFPDAKIIHIVRDGRDCANSLVRTYDVLTDDKLTHLKASEMRMGRPYDQRYVPWWVPRDEADPFMESSPFVRAIWMWKVMVRKCHETFLQLDEHAQKRVLVIQYEDLMQNPLQCSTRILDHFEAEPTAATRRRLEQAHTRSIGKHERRPSDEVRQAEQVAHRELSLYGYSVHLADTKHAQ